MTYDANSSSSSQPGPPAPSPDESVAVTVLPNGTVGVTGSQTLSLSVFLTLSLPETKPFGGSQFEHWCDDNQSLLGAATRTGTWGFEFIDSAGAIVNTSQALLRPNVTPLRADIWELIFAKFALTAPTHKSRGAYPSAPWIVSTDAARQEYGFKQMRINHALWRKLRREQKLLTRRPAIAQIPQAGMMANLAKDLTAELDASDVYLHPQLGSSTGPSLQGLLADREFARDTTTVRALLNLPPDALDLITKRFNLAIKLHDSAESPLSPAGLFGLWAHCIASISTEPEARTNPQWDLLTARAQLLTYAGSAVFKNPMTPADIGKARDSIEFLLFSRTNNTTQPTPPDPDFHQTLGLIQRYPALLRPLGLVIDLQVDVPNLAAGASYAVRAKLTPPPSAPALPAGSLVFLSTHLVGVRPETFRARSRYETALAARKPGDPPPDLALLPMNTGSLVMQPLLNAKPSIVASSHNMLGEHHKFFNLAFSRRRSVQHKHKPTDDELPSLPAVDTPGIQLLHVFRQERTTALRNITPNPATPLFADDLVLGYRIDARSNAPQPEQMWHALCGRTSTYKPIGLAVWKPKTPTELAADEGFVTLGGTVQDDMLRISQTFATWAGDNLAVPDFFAPTPPNQTAKYKFPVVPKFDIEEFSDLPLRYGREYSLRVRVVDLAGNSPLFLETFDETFGKDLILVHPFDREQPYRAPQLLLTAPIDKANDPGANISTLILRDGEGKPERALVPPHETRKHVEFSGALDKEWSEGAFTDYALTDTGAFPSVDGTPQGDGLLQKGDPADGHDPFFPDPGVRKACFYSLDGPLLFSENVSDYTLTLNFYKSGDWPDVHPLFFQLLPARDGVARLERSRDGNAALCFLPPATDCTLELSSASDGQQMQQLGPLVEPASTHDLYPPTIPAAPPSVPPLKGLPPAAFLAGTDPGVSPTQTLRLIHAVRRPLAHPVVADLKVTRNFQEATASVSGTISPHFPSTGKTLFHATWCVLVDDPAKPEPQRHNYSEAAFSITYTRKDSPNGTYDDNPVPLGDLQHCFQDTRAHLVTYRIESSTCFKPYYPEGSDPRNDHLFSITKAPEPALTVLASVRPPAPVVDYIIPAFEWIRTRSHNQLETSRQTWLRIWLKRPFPITDNDQELGIVLALRDEDRGIPGKNLVSQIGMNPIYPLQGKGLTRAQMDISMFPQFTTGDPYDGLIKAETCRLAECIPDTTLSGNVTVLPVPVKFEKSRNLWFADVCIQAVQDGFSARAPFLQLALVRYAPNGMPGTSPADDARISPVVTADIIQLLENRWCSITRSGREVNLVLTGPFSLLNYPDKPTYSAQRQRWEYEPLPGQTSGPTPRFSLELEHAMHDEKRTLEWFPMNSAEVAVAISQVSNPEDDGIATFKFSVTLPHNTFWWKYRVLLMEEQRLEQASGNPIYSPRYFEEIEL